MATNSDDMFDRLFSGAKPEAENGPGEKSEPKEAPRGNAKEEPKPKTKPKATGRKTDAKKRSDPDGSRLFGSVNDATPKTARIQLVVKDKERERWRTAAKEYNVSLTQFIETVLNDFCERNGL